MVLTSEGLRGYESAWRCRFSADDHSSAENLRRWYDHRFIKSKGLSFLKERHEVRTTFTVKSVAEECHRSHSNDRSDEHVETG